jgi:hypothetical protein
MSVHSLERVAVKMLVLLLRKTVIFRHIVVHLTIYMYPRVVDTSHKDPAVILTLYWIAGSL